MKQKHASENKKFDAMFSANLRQEWSTMIRDWERNKSKPNPYTHTEKGILTPVSQFLVCLYLPSQ